MRSEAQRLRVTLNGRAVEFFTHPMQRLSSLLRQELGLTGTKVGCDAGDCGACTVLLDGAQVCACLVHAGRLEGCCVDTVEGLAAKGELTALQAAFLRHGAAQCGICTPGMLMAATELLSRNATPNEAEVQDALGGVLCRCTGYRAIIDAVLDVAGVSVPVAGAVGASIPRVDGVAKLVGDEKFGADALPEAAFLSLRAVRSPHPHARFTLGDFAPVLARHPGLVRALTAADLPGARHFGIYPTGKDQPVLADGYVRHRGEPVCALVGDEATLLAIDDRDLPITWEVLAPVTFEDALARPALHPHLPGNLLCQGRVAKGNVATPAAHKARISVETRFIEHAYIEPEAGFAVRRGERIEVAACTQTPYMDRDEIALILGIAPERVRVVPTATGGGFGGKLDLSVQPLLAVAAWLLDRPVRWVFTRPESMASTTKRHPARITAEAGCDVAGRLVRFRFQGDFNTGAYASWGPTVANRVPVHATGPYHVPHVLAETRAIHTTDPSAGAFRGFGVPQAALAGEALMDRLADSVGMDALEFRLKNALGPHDATATGQVLGQGAALAECLVALRPHWQEMLAEVARHNATATGQLRQGAGVACMWYGIGNTSMSNPSAMRITLAPDGTITLFSGAHDIGQGSHTVMVQIAAEALGVAPAAITLVAGDTDRTEDAGKTSASRQTFVSGNAARLAGEALRREILRAANAEPDAVLLPGTPLRVRDGARETAVAEALSGHGRYDPPTTALDANGQGKPYAAYAFAAQCARVEVDLELGTTRVLEIAAAHDVGRAINPQMVVGQVHGGIAQGLGLALMEEYVPGRTENLHDYLIPTIGDVPPITVELIEKPDPEGPYGAKGVGEPALIATAPAILAAMRMATGAELAEVPATPARVRAAILAKHP
jgi:CO/xanthine dehydrogenase Mo-binding subunit/aerobic-type carbon monoxide dehydrogenase small subunit (CoxS/CutS family)